MTPDPDRDPTARVTTFWERSHAAESAADSFLDHPLIHAYLSLRAFGTTEPHLGRCIAEIQARTSPGAVLLSVGCGGANKEMAICRALPDRTVVGIDVADETLERTRQRAADRGLANLRLQRADFNRLELPPAGYDMILGLGAIHHVEQLEAFWQQCRRALRPGGCVLAQEYVGPSRFQWSAAQIEHGDRILAELVPPEHLVHHRRVRPIDLRQLIALDPSEAVRSAEILPTCEATGLTVTAYWGGGCSLLQPALMNQIHTFDPRNWRHNGVLFTLFAEEERLMQAGVLGDTFAMFVAEPDANVRAPSKASHPEG